MAQAQATASRQAQATTPETTAFQAQHGWGLPKLVATPSITQGVVLDPTANRMIIAETTGLEQRDLAGGQPKMLLDQTGVRYLRGVSSGKQLTLAWYRRDAINANGVWWWFNGTAELALKTPFSEFVLLQVAQKPVLLMVGQVGTNTVIYQKNWKQNAKIIYRTPLNIGAFAAAATPDGRMAMVFAEGYRTSVDEKYDARFLEVSATGSRQSRILAPAVYAGRDQHYGVAVLDNQFIPIWWFETEAEQRLAAFTGRHNPRLALKRAKNLLEFAPAAQVLGQVGSKIYYTVKNLIYTYDLKTKATQIQLTAPESFSTATLLTSGSTNFIAWQSLQRDSFTSRLWLADSSKAYQPSTIDHIAVGLGWNPWFPLENFFGQTALALIFAAGAVLLIAPIAWLLQARFEQKQAVFFGVAIAWVFLLGLRLLGGATSATGWIFEPLLTPSWWLVLLGLVLGTGLAYWQRRRLQSSELGTTITASLIVLVSAFVTVFSKVGFLQF